MKNKRSIIPVHLLILSVLLSIISANTFAQNVPTTKLLPDTAKMTYNQISQAAKLFVYPAKGQTQQQQKKDEFDCYMWAVEQSGIDPLNIPKVEAPAPQTGPTGGAVVGAAKGAVAGAAIGAIAGDAGKGAAIGAVAGGLGGRARWLRSNRTNRHKHKQQPTKRKSGKLLQKHYRCASKEKVTPLNNHPNLKHLKTLICDL
jgi:hypothetical protein